MSDFKVGDVVELKSGGPKMTVHSITDKSSPFECVWFAGDDVKYRSFPAAVLKKVDEA